MRRFRAASRIGPSLRLVALCTVFAVTARVEADPAAPGPRERESAPPTLDGLFRDLSKLTGLYARFEEKKRILLLKVPLESRGSVYFMRPMLLARHVEHPLRSAMYIDAGRLTLVDSNGVRTLDLGANAVVSALAGSFIHVLRGDRPALEKNFNLDFAADGAKWTLTLRPKAAELARVLTELSFSGEGLEVHSMKMREATGDESSTTFSAVDTKRAYTEAERARFFRPPTK